MPLLNFKRLPSRTIHGDGASTIDAAQLLSSIEVQSELRRIDALYYEMKRIATQKSGKSRRRASDKSVKIAKINKKKDPA